LRVARAFQHFSAVLDMPRMGQCGMPKDRSKTYSDRQSEASRGQKKQQPLKKQSAKKKPSRNER